jgi:hypothetical protein
MHLFYAKTNDAFIFKIFAELLHANLKTVCFEVEQKGIKINQTDVKSTKLFSAYFFASNFDQFTLNSSSTLNIGINMSYLHKTLKTLKKKDTIEFIVDDQNSKELLIQVSSKDNNSRLAKTFIQIQDIQIIDPELPSGYSSDITIKSSDFQKIIKDTLNLGKLVNISSNKTKIKFFCNTIGINKREIEFGSTDSKDDFDYTDVFDSKDILKILKFTCLNSSFSIFTHKDLPLHIHSNISSLGYLDIYIKSKQQIENDTS